MESTPDQSASAPKSLIVQSVRSMYGLETIFPSKVSCSPFSKAGPIISKAEIYCELTFPNIDNLPPFRRFPFIRRGGYPSSPTYSISAPRCRSASTSVFIGLCFMRSVPVSTWLCPGRMLRYAVMNLMAVPAALMFISSGISLRAETITSVSSQLERFSGKRIAFPDISAAMALITSALLLMLFDAGRVISVFMLFGALTIYFINCIFLEYIS